MTPDQSFADFELDGWDDASIAPEYDRHLSRERRRSTVFAHRRAPAIAEHGLLVQQLGLTTTTSLGIVALSPTRPVSRSAARIGADPRAAQWWRHVSL